MRITLTVALSALLWLAPTPAGAQLSAEGHCPGANNPLVAYAQETITVSGSPIGPTQAIYNPISGGFAGSVPIVAAVTVAAGALVGPISALDTSTNPGATAGMVYQPGQRFWICGRSISAVKFVAQGLASGLVQIIYLRAP